MQLCATVCNYLQLYATVNRKNIWYNIIVDLRVHPPIDIGYRKTFLRERLFVPEFRGNTENQKGRCESWQS